MCPSSHSEGKLVVISGPSGTGKSTVCKRLTEISSRYELSVSATTRPPRSGEAGGVHYFFISREEFERKARKGEFAEYAEYAGNLYGTPKAPLDEAVAAGTVVLLDIDTQGARQVAEHYPDALTIFLEPPDFDELLRRLNSRATDTAGQKQRRLNIAKREMEQRGRYRYRVVNDDLNETVRKLHRIIEGEN